MSLDRKKEIKKQIAKLQKELKELDNNHLDFSKLNEISRYAFGSISIDFRKIAISIHFLQCWRKDICANNIIEFTRYGRAKIRELTQEQIQESNELLQKMLEPFVEKIKEKLTKHLKNIDNKDC